MCIHCPLQHGSQMSALPPASLPLRCMYSCRNAGQLIAKTLKRRMLTGWLWSAPDGSLGYGCLQFFGFVYTCRPFMASWKPLAFLVFGLMAEEFLLPGSHILSCKATGRSLVCDLRFGNRFQPLPFSVPRLPHVPGSHNSGGIHIAYGHYLRLLERAIRSSLARHSGPFHKQRNRSAAILAVVSE